MNTLVYSLRKIGLKAFLVVLLMGCTSDFLDINNDPNNPTSASLDFLLPAAQAATAFNTSRTIHQDASIFVQHFYTLGSSTYNLNASNYSNDFSFMYAMGLKDFETIIKQANERGSGFSGYAGVSKVMMAYSFLMLVDAFGDVPFEEALKGETIKSPRYDDDATVYQRIADMLVEAKADLDVAITGNEPRIATDLVYGSSSTGIAQYGRWKKAANTILLRMYLNIRKVDPAQATSGINALITENNFITSNDDDFQLVYGNTQAPLTRHPIFQQEYAGAGKGFYMTNYFMYHMIARADPRLPFYIFRQGKDSDIANPPVANTQSQTRPCRNRPDCVYGWLTFDPQVKGLPALPAGSADGYIGRDHGDPSGQPNDNQIRATFGVYPIGGSYDRGPGGGSRTISVGATGAGVIPWMTNFMRAFMLAEAALTLGTPGSPLALTLEGIDASFNKVETFGKANDGAAQSMVTTAKDSYKTAITTAYNAATNDDERLNVIITEKYYANFGNGMEAFTDYRRTNKPANLPISLAPTGPAPRRFPLPPSEVNANKNAPNPPPLVTEKIFWDN
jgi:hypothetical protein